MQLNQTLELLDVHALSAKIGIAVPTLNRWRGQGIGPAHIKMHHRVAYLQSDVNSWLESQRRTFTREGGAV